jgi:hypothetical protein
MQSGEFAEALSLLFHPLMLPLYLFVAFTSLPLSFSVFPLRARFIYGSVIFISTFMIPALLVGLMKTLGLVHSLHLDDRKERNLPFLTTAVVYYFSSRFLQRAGIPVEFTMMLLGSAALILVAMAVNFWWKISIHMLGVGGATGMIAAFAFWIPERFFLPMVIATGISGLVGYARISGGSHRPAEVYTGYLFGLLLFFFIFRFSLSG